MIKALNVGCGGNVKKSDKNITWTHIDCVPTNGAVTKMDARKLTFKDGEFDLVYASHLLEHMSSAECSPVLKGWIRVLKRGGILKVCVPNLDMICAFLTCRKLNIGNAISYIYGNQRDNEPGSFHRNGFDKIRLIAYLQPLGIKDFKSFRGTPDDASNSIFSLNLEGIKA